MVGTGKVDHLEIKKLLLEVSRIPERNGEPDASERSGLGPRDDLEEGSPSWAEVLPRDPHLFEGVSVEDVKAAPAIHQHLHEARSPNDGADNEWETPWAGDMSRVVMLAKGYWYLQPT